jgi:hypothetical protein
MATPDALLDDESVPQALPLQPAPVSFQLTPLFCGSFCRVPVKLCVPMLACTLLVVGETATIMGCAALSVMVAEADLLASDTEVAVSVTVAGVGTLAGAVYVMEMPDALLLAESVPQVAPVQPAPVSDQLTPLFCASFVTVAEKGFVPPLAWTFAEVGRIATLITGGTVMVIIATADFVASATEVAVRVTVAGEGTAGGAV